MMHQFLHLLISFAIITSFIFGLFIVLQIISKEEKILLQLFNLKKNSYEQK